MSNVGGEKCPETPEGERIEVDDSVRIDPPEFVEGETGIEDTYDELNLEVEEGVDDGLGESDKKPGEDVIESKKDKITWFEKHPLGRKFIKVGAAVMLVFSLSNGLAGCGESSNNNTAAKTEQTPSPTPTAEQKLDGLKLEQLTDNGDLAKKIHDANTILKDMSPEQQTAWLEIKKGQSDDELVNTLFDRFTRWQNAGAYYGMYHDYDDLKSTATHSTIATKQEKIFADAIFSAGWESDANLSATADWFQSMDAKSINNYLATAYSDNCQEAQAEWVTILNYSVTHSADGTVDIEARVKQINNADKNLPTPIDKPYTTFHIELKSQGDDMVITSVDHASSAS